MSRWLGAIRAQLAEHRHLLRSMAMAGQLRVRPTSPRPKRPPSQRMSSSPTLTSEIARLIDSAFWRRSASRLSRGERQLWRLLRRRGRGRPRRRSQREGLPMGVAQELPLQQRLRPSGRLEPRVALLTETSIWVISEAMEWGAKQIRRTVCGSTERRTNLTSFLCIILMPQIHYRLPIVSKPTHPVVSASRQT